MNYQEAFISNLTLDYIIDTLRKSGINSKKLIIDKLTNASEFDLLTLKRSIQERINYDKQNHRKFIRAKIS